MPIKKQAKVLAASTGLLALTANAASAQNYSFWSWFFGGSWSNSGSTGGSSTTYSDVPEIDAGAGLLAVAAVAAAMLLVWERRRRRKQRA